MPGRFRTASRPFKTLILLESYTSFCDMRELVWVTRHYSPAQPPDPRITFSIRLCLVYVFRGCTRVHTEARAGRFRGVCGPPARKARATLLIRPQIMEI